MKRLTLTRCLQCKSKPLIHLEVSEAWFYMMFLIEWFVIESLEGMPKERGGVHAVPYTQYQIWTSKRKQWWSNLALGAASHGIGTARAVQIDETAGAFSGIAMGLNGLLTAAILPLIWRWLF